MPIGLVPAILGAAAIGTGGSIAAAELGKPNLSTQQGILKQVASTAIGAGSADVSAGSSALDTLLGQYQAEAKGGQAATQQAGPQINALASQYRNATKQLSEFAPRGGGTSSSLEGAPFSLAGAITNLLNTNQQTAMQGEGNVASTLLGGGTNLLSTATGAAGTSGSLALSASAQQDQILSSLGSSLGSLLGTAIASGSSGGGNGSLANLLSGLFASNQSQNIVNSLGVPGD